MDQKGSISLGLVFVVLFAILGFMFGIVIPMLNLFNVKIWEHSNFLLDETIESANNINDAELREKFLDSTQSAKDATTDIVDSLAKLVQYSWVLITLLIVFVLFIQARQQVEVAQIP